MIDLAADLALIKEAALAAGALAEAERERGLKITHKDGGSPVTNADLAVDAIRAWRGPQISRRCRGA